MQMLHWKKQKKKNLKTMCKTHICHKQLQKARSQNVTANIFTLQNMLNHSVPCNIDKKIQILNSTISKILVAVCELLHTKVIIQNP